MPLGGEGAPRPATLRDVAELAQVHPSTVSRVLNSAARSRVTAATAVRIRAIASELGYQPNLMARGLRTRRTRSVGVIVTDISNPVIPPIVRGIERRLGDEGYTVLLANTDHSARRERRQLEAMRAKLVDGLIMATATREHDALLAELRAMAMPVVLVNRAAEDDGISAAVPDDGFCAELAVAHLAQLGHERIAHVAGSPSTTTGLRRRRGFEAALARRGLRVDPELVTTSERYTLEEGARCFGELLARRAGEFTAVFAANDLLALGCYEALERAGLDCPGSVSVVGCNDMPFADRFTPSLSTIHIPHLELGRSAAELLLERLEDPAQPARQVLVAPRLVARASSARPGSAAAACGRRPTSDARMGP